MLDSSDTPSQASGRQRAAGGPSVGTSLCAAASPSRATSRCRCRGRACRTASTARSRRTGRTCTRRTRSSELLDRAARRGVKELLVLTGDDPAHHPGVRERLAELGLRGLRRLRRVGVRAGAGARAAAAHEPRRAVARRPRPAARGDGVAGADARVARAPTSSRTRARRRRTPRCGWRRSAAAGELRSRSRAASSSGSARREEDRSRRSRRSPPCTPSTATCRRSSCRTSCRTAATTARSRPTSRPTAAEAYWRTGPARTAPDVPAAAVGVAGHDRGHEAPRRGGARG